MPDNILELPPGSIIAWIPGNDELKSSDLNERWQICDGSPIRDGVWEGKPTPNLTNAFLVGGAESEVTVAGLPGPINMTYPDPAEVNISTEEICTSSKIKNTSSETVVPTLSMECEAEATTHALTTEKGFPEKYDLRASDNLPTYKVVYIMRVR